ncbi:DUF2624 family protein [Halalkalibacillus halophilus]|uniref:DUF2624 family protein n=1 Tax=Halalkalibacillus halophilus TaxID=392827 RepID=UPI0004086C92|nr:DUF2624 family protein [Halalkalibacillus halophilus]
MYRNFVQHYLNQLSPKKLSDLSKQYEIPISIRQAEQILQFIKEKRIDPFNKKDRLQTIRFIEDNIGAHEARSFESLILQLAKQYNLEHLL